MDIDRVIEILREAKKKSSCPPGFKYNKKEKRCVLVKKKGKKGKYGYIRSYLGGGYRGGDNRSGNGDNDKNGNGNGNGNGHGGNGNGNGGNGGGNGGGGNGGGGGE